MYGDQLFVIFKYVWNLVTYMFTYVITIGLIYVLMTYAAFVLFLGWIDGWSNLPSLGSQLMSQQAINWLYDTLALVSHIYAH